MKKRWTLSAMLLALFLGIVGSQKAQDFPEGSKRTPKPPTRAGTAVALMRTICTSEMGELQKYGSFAEWQTLLAHNSDYLDQFAAMQMHRQNIPNARLGEPPEVIPGWNLRLNVHADGQGFDLMLLDATDKKCGYALVTDESTAFRESKFIGCGM